MFYQYSQNNSGGFYNGPKTIIIEANSSDEADSIAKEKTPIYFDGVSKGVDCECCGNRWYNCFNDGDEEPSIYGEPIHETDNDYEIYYLSGAVVTVN